MTAEQVFNQAISAEDAQNWPEAERLYRLLPQVPEACNNLGVIVQRRKDFEGAASCYAKAVGLSPDYAEAWNNLGSARYELGELNNALEALGRACKLGYPQAWLNRGICERDLGLLESALESLRRAPESAERYAVAGGILHTMGRVDEALEALEKALRMEPASVNGRFNMALARLSKGDLAAGWRFWEARKDKMGFNRYELPEGMWKTTITFDPRVPLDKRNSLGKTMRP